MWVSRTTRPEPQRKGGSSCVPLPSISPETGADKGAVIPTWIKRGYSVALIIDMLLPFNITFHLTVCRGLFATRAQPRLRIPPTRRLHFIWMSQPYNTGGKPDVFHRTNRLAVTSFQAGEARWKPWNASYSQLAISWMLMYHGTNERCSTTRRKDQPTFTPRALETQASRRSFGNTEERTSSMVILLPSAFWTSAKRRSYPQWLQERW